jgi:hypothetical protein
MREGLTPAGGDEVVVEPVHEGVDVVLLLLARPCPTGYEPCLGLINTALVT